MTDDPKTDDDAQDPSDDAEAPQAEEPTAEAAQADEPTAETAQADEPTAAEAAQAEEPTAEAPKAAEAKPAEAPQPDAKPAPAVEEPASLAPLIGVVALILVALVVGQMLNTGDADAALSPEELILQGNKQQTAAEGIPYFKRAIEVDEGHDHPQAHAALGRAYAFRNEFDLALEHLIFARDNTPESDPAPPEVHLLIGMSYLGLERVDDAVEPLELAASMRPDDYRPHYYLAMVGMHRDDPEATAQHLEHLLDDPNVPDRALAYRWYAQAMDRMGKPAGAIAALERLAELKPNDVSARYDLQRRRIDDLGYEQALADTRERAAAEGASPMDRYVLAWTLTLDAARRAESIPLLEALQADEPAPWVSLTLANERIREGEVAEARALLEQTLETAPTFVDGETKLAYVLRLQGEFAAARELYQKLLRSGATFVAQQELINTHLEAGELAEALAFAEEQTKLYEATDPQRLLVGKVLQAQGEFEAAREVLVAIRDARPAADQLVWQTRIALWALEAGAESAADDFRTALDVAGERRPPDLLLWAGVALSEADPERAQALWTQAAETGSDQDPEALYTASARRLLGQGDLAALEAAGRLGGPRDANDVWTIEGLARERAGDAAGALEAYQRAVEVSLGVEFPAQFAQRAVARLQ